MKLVQQETLKPPFVVSLPNEVTTVYAQCQTGGPQRLHVHFTDFKHTVPREGTNHNRTHLQQH